LQTIAAWKPKLVANLRALLAQIDQQFGLITGATFGNKMAKRRLDDIALSGANATDKEGPGLGVETVHQVKSEYIDAVLYIGPRPTSAHCWPVPLRRKAASAMWH